MAIIYRHLKPCSKVFYIGIGTLKSYLDKNIKLKNTQIIFDSFCN